MDISQCAVWQNYLLCSRDRGRWKVRRAKGWMLSWAKSKDVGYHLRQAFAHQRRGVHWNCCRRKICPATFPEGAKPM